MLDVTAITDLRNVKQAWSRCGPMPPCTIPSRKRWQKRRLDRSSSAHLRLEKFTEGTVGVNGREATAWLEKHTCVWDAVALLTTS
ncbi:MAG: hypothetical protein HC871_16960 [Rhizobiales bacterium]|nr:hypothetical protein [Hyphomicrobiales bacterium]